VRYAVNVDHDSDSALWARSRTRVAAYALCRDAQNRLLLTRIAPGYPAPGQWTLPGGGINFGERPQDAVLRELTEETGLIGRVDSLAFVHSFARSADAAPSSGPWHGIRIVYRVTITGGTLRHEVDESTDQAAWWTLDEIAAMPHVDLVQATLAWLDDPSAHLM
jgi:ADP-ribose pyrophosphatase YjhB (NUDIX family)